MEKKFKTWLNESTFAGNAIYNPIHTYCKDVINKLLNGDEIRLGKDGTAGVVTIEDYDANELKKLLNVPVSDLTVEMFNACSKTPNGFWTKIFKGDFTGYTNGSKSGNKGNAFEYELYDEIKQYINTKELTPNIANLLKIIDGDIIDVKADGALNQKRPLTFDGNSITCRKSETVDIGKTVTDITITIKHKKKEEKEYLSLKYGSTVTFVNAGVMKILPPNEILKGKIENKNGQALLKMFGIDNEKFCKVFIDKYNSGNVEENIEENSFIEYLINEAKKSEKDVVDITSVLKSNKNFTKFLKSVIGYGYILIHKIGKEIHFIDMREEKALNDLIKVEKAAVYYPKNGSAARVDILVRLNGLELKFNIRSKTGGYVLPTHLMSDYKFLD